jgi:hypothetical protein
MTRKLNQYMIGSSAPPMHLVGRENIIRKCYESLVSRDRHGIAISGGYGVGKTSLLQYLRHTAQQERWGQPYTRSIFVYLSCPTIEQFTPMHFWRRILEQIKQQETENSTLHRQIDEILERGKIEVLYLQHFLHDLEQQRCSLVLLLDDFDWIIKANTARQTTVGDFLSQLRAFTYNPDYSLILFTATRERLDELCRDIVKDRPECEFYHSLAFQFLPLFTKSDIDALFKQVRKESDFAFDTADREFLYRITGGYPALLQVAGYLLFEARRHAPVSRETYKEIMEDFEREVHNVYSQ